MAGPLFGEAQVAGVLLRDPLRLRVLRATGLLDGAGGPALDRLTRLAGRLVGVPIAVVSMVDAERQVFPSGMGVPQAYSTPLSHSFCQHVVAGDGPMIVTDARSDARVCDNPAVAESGVIAYAGFPLRSPQGQPLGTFSVADSRPRAWTDDELHILEDLSVAAESEIAMRLSHAELVFESQRRQAILDAAKETGRLRTIIAVQREVAAAAADPDRMLPLVAERAMEALSGADAAMVGMVEGDEIHAAAAAGALRAFAGARVPVAGSLAGLVVSSGTTLRCDDAANDDQVKRTNGISATVGSMVVAPLFADGRVFGTLGVSSPRAHAFDDADTEQLTLMADALTGALRHTQTNSALQASEARFRSAFEALRQRAQLLDLTQDAVIVRDLDGRITYWNPAAERIYGWTADVACGDDLGRLLGADSAEDVDGALDELGVWAGELEHRRADGRTVIVLARKALQRDSDGNPVAVLSINTDVTARRAAELALRESELRFRTQFAHSAVGQVIRGPDGLIQEVNPAFAAMIGYPAEELVGTSASRHIAPDSDQRRQRARSLAGVHAGQSDSYQQQCRLICADGRLLDVDATVSAIRDDTGQPVRFVAMFQDISARVAAEAARDTAIADLAGRNTQLEDANQLKQDLIGMLGHEIGNPLSSILGYTELLTENAGGVPAEKQKGMLAAIDRNAHQLDGIVREVLTMVTLDAGRMTAVPEPVAVRRHLEDALANAGAVGAVIDCPADLVASVQPRHLAQILTNLLSNAAKYGGGATAITAGSRGTGVRIAVHDAGPGVPAELREHLFDRFSRAAGTAATVKGTGLGLYIVRELARANHGDVHYEPAPGHGSIFVLTLPVP